MSTPYPVRLAGEELWLLPEKALYWPAQQALLIADVHFGKAAAYRSLGQPVPQGTTAAISPCSTDCWPPCPADS